MRRTVLPLLLLAMLLPTTAVAVPKTLSLQGYLRTSGGAPVPDGDYGLTVRFYDKQVGGAELYSDLSPGVKVQGGVFDMTVGVVKPLDLQAFTTAQATWVGVSIGTEPELPRAPLHAVPYAVRALVATQLACSACVGAAQLEPGVLAGLTKSGELAKVATSGLFADLTGGPDLTAYAKLGELAKVAKTGAFADLTGGPNLSAYAKLADLGPYAKAVELAAVATSGSYTDLKGTPDLKPYAKIADLPGVAQTGKFADLNGIPPLAQLGKACGSGLFVRGLLADGALDCAVPEVKVTLPPDGLAAVSNGALTNVFVVASAKTPAAPIPDNSPLGATDELDVPDVGTVQSLTVSVKVLNSDISGLTVKLYDPNLKTYVLHDKSGNGGVLDTTYPQPSMPVSGDLGGWIGKNPKGKWRLEVIDSKFFNNKDDGQLVAWKVTTQAVSAQNVEVKGDVAVLGAVLPGAFRFPIGAAAPFACTPDRLGFAYLETGSTDLKVCRGGKWTAAVFRECGNGVVEAPEACDDGAANSDAPGKCRTTCLKPACGDKIIDPGEPCDDGNDVTTDGCDACKIPCANGYLYNSVCLRAVVQTTNGNQPPAGCTPYQPAVKWGQPEYLAICNYFSPKLGKTVNCAAVDTDADGGLCNNYQALLSWEANSSPDIWLHSASFTWNPKNGANNCNLVSAGDDIVVYACK
ncbi:MAG: DUF4215 domain-containing protein [Myxococcales bacterium]|nr:DUF4215 domain-containing protein [Myxococcales bacterium]